MVHFGYIRVSSASQEANTSLTDQKQQLKTFGVSEENILEEIASASTMCRPVLRNLIDSKLSAGDTLVVSRLDRFSRNIIGCMIEVNGLHNRGITFKHLDI